MNLGTGFEWQGKRRFPRVFMTGIESNQRPLQGVLLSLPNRAHVPVLDLSVSGVIISPQGLLSQFRLGATIDGKLRVAGSNDPILLRLRVIRLMAGAVCLMMDSISSENRLKIEQTLKDRLIFQNLHEMAPQALHPSLQKGVWWNAPFDTNFLLWRNAADATLRKMVIEYDGALILWNAGFDQNEVQIRKSVPAADETRGYGGLWLDPEGPKVSLGHNWKERLMRLIEASPHAEKLAPFCQLLVRV